MLGGARWVCVCAAAALAVSERPGGALGVRILRPAALRPGAHTRPRPPSLALRLPRSAHSRAERPLPPLSLSLCRLLPQLPGNRGSRGGRPGCAAGRAPRGNARLGLLAPELCAPQATAPPVPRARPGRGRSGTAHTSRGSSLCSRRCLDLDSTPTCLSSWLPLSCTRQGVRNPAATASTRLGNPGTPH